MGSTAWPSRHQIEVATSVRRLRSQPAGKETGEGPSPAPFRLPPASPSAPAVPPAAPPPPKAEGRRALGADSSGLGRGVLMTRICCKGARVAKHGGPLTATKPLSVVTHNQVRFLLHWSERRAGSHVAGRSVLQCLEGKCQGDGCAESHSGRRLQQGRRGAMSLLWGFLVVSRVSPSRGQKAWRVCTALLPSWRLSFRFSGFSGSSGLGRTCEELRVRSWGPVTHTTVPLPELLSQTLSPPGSRSATNHARGTGGHG